MLLGLTVGEGAMGGQPLEDGKGEETAGPPEPPGAM